MTDKVSMAPVAWMNTMHNGVFIDLDGSVYRCPAYEAGELTPLYTAEQLDEARRQERERCVKACHGKYNWNDAVIAIRALENEA